MYIKYLIHSMSCLTCAAWRTLLWSAIRKERCPDNQQRSNQQHSEPHLGPHIPHLKLPSTRPKLEGSRRPLRRPHPRLRPLHHLQEQDQRHHLHHQHPPFLGQPTAVDLPSQRWGRQLSAARLVAHEFRLGVLPEPGGEDGAAQLRPTAVQGWPERQW